LSDPSVIDSLVQAVRAGPLASMAIGNAVMGAALLASQLKDQAVAMRFRGDGPLGDVYAEATYDGRIRVHVSNPLAELAPGDDPLDVAKGIGAGFLDVITTLPGLATPQVSTVALMAGGIGDDIAYYLHQSQQVLSVVALGLKFKTSGQVVAAGGIIIELMQSVPEDLIHSIETAVGAAGPLSARLLAGDSPADLAAAYLQNLALVEVPHPFELRFTCPCSWERVLRAFTLLGRKELISLIALGSDREVTCEFCHKKYQVTSEDLRGLLDS